MLLKRITKNHRTFQALGGIMLSCGSSLMVIGILLSRRGRLEGPLPIQPAPAAWEEPLTMGLLILGAILLGLSIPLNVAVLRDRRAREKP
ncbi:MAG: hypothetical protein GY838_13825 [bacterium]|nr:hypothetical protein [bacterium]